MLTGKDLRDGGMPFGGLWWLVLTMGGLLLAPGTIGQVRGDEPVLPKYGARALRLFHCREYVRRADAADFWALMPYYVPQFNERSCSVASATMVLNAIRSNHELTSRDELITQAGLLEAVDSAAWKKCVGHVGGGVSIEELTRYLDKALRVYGLRGYEVEPHRFRADDPSPGERFRRVLAENEQSDADFLIVFFWQQELTDDPEGASGHVAPVAAYDEANDRVLIFDPDRQWYEPYWVSVDTLVAGMTKLDRGTGRPRGYIWIKPDRIADTARLEPAAKADSTESN